MGEIRCPKCGATFGTKMKMDNHIKAEHSKKERRKKSTFGQKLG